jgi:hypothetical protein
VSQSAQNSRSFFAIYMATSLGHFPESATKFNALQFSQEGSSG